MAYGSDIPLLHAFSAQAAGFVVRAILFSALGIFALVGFILARRTIRRRYFDRLAEAEFYVRQHWEEILAGDIPTSEWRAIRAHAEAIIALTLDRLDVAEPPEAENLLTFLRQTGLLDRLVVQARRHVGWQRETALVRLGRTRAPEAVQILVAALDDPHANMQLAAVRALARTGLTSAAEAMLERLLSGDLKLKGTSLLNALMICTRANPRIVFPYLFLARGEKRELLARVIAEMPAEKTAASLGDEVLLLAADPLPEVRACAARALAHAEFGFAFPTLATLARDQEWFVRLRAVTSLGRFSEARAVPVLLHGICDRNRHVRQRAAEALVRIPDSLSVLRDVLKTGDAYALQAMIAELDRTGEFDKLLEKLESGSGRRMTAESRRVLQALESAADELGAMIRIPPVQKTAKTS
jgi:HEAT repeat protein